MVPDEERESKETEAETSHVCNICQESLCQGLWDTAREVIGTWTALEGQQSAVKNIEARDDYNLVTDDVSCSSVFFFDNSYYVNLFFFFQASFFKIKKNASQKC